jgi:hypothetical protein
MVYYDHQQKMANIENSVLTGVVVEGGKQLNRHKVQLLLLQHLHNNIIFKLWLLTAK